MPKKYSHSKLSSYEQCPTKYKFRYIDRIIVIEKTIEAFLGKSVHETLEFLHQTKMDKQTIPTINAVIEHFSNNWEEKYTPDIKLTRQDFALGDYFNKGIQFLLDYYKSNYPFKDNTIAIEKKITINLDENNENGGIQIDGFIDRLVYNLETGEYEIHDYKTANSLPPKEKIDTDRQLALYSIAIKQEYGEEKEVNLIWHFLAFNKKIESKRTKEQLEGLKQDILKTVKEIESATKFPPQKSKLCDWCEYKSICPAYDDTLTEEEYEDIISLKAENEY
jgi:putative RecB family exonuclease